MLIRSHCTPFAETPDCESLNFHVADYNRDGTPDLWGIQKQGTSTGNTEVHVLNGLDFQQFLAHENTVQPAIGNSDAWATAVADYDRDGMMDLWFIARSGTTTGTTELHVMDGNGFDRWFKHEATALAETGTGNNWSFVVGNFDADETPDIAAIGREGTASGQAEIHIINGKRPYQFISHSSSGLHEVGITLGWVFT